ncbi:PASTA domain-containing protein [candidate division KSB3 bacterium]|uniref:PASTA domain-containing protein n=1 Tax=candidate division KSB3 bacterium TaxID=2044937 RepID=A0A9D5Q4F6_9BACT|nr:PASTA domain-containing protein [candidate division KSB3 bacterium]MBD3323669.1 PASTA domain-containing protein [candidate division KSB3 bacterium]
MRRFITRLLKVLLFCCFLVTLAGFSGIATIRYIFATSEVTIPDLRGKDLDYASDLLAQHQLTLKVVDQQLNATIPKDHVIAQDPEPDTQIPKMHTVRIILSNGLESTLVPDLIGKSWQEATRLLRQQQFRIGHIAYAHSPTVPIDKVIAQTPLPNRETEARIAVDLLVSRGPYKTVMVMPDLVEEQLAYARQTVEQLGLVVGKIEHERYEGIPSDTVLSQNPKPGALVEEQDIVTLVVSGSPGRGMMPGTSGATSVQYQSLAYIVPPGRFEREVAVIVKNVEGITEIYRQLVPPGNRIVVRVPVIGETVVEIYLDGTLETIQRLDAQ